MIRGFFKFLCILLVLALLAVGYARFIEPNIITEKTVKVPGSSGFGPMRIAIFSDLHVSEHMTPAELTEIVSRINAMEPDVVIFLGDLFDDYSRYGGDPAEISEVLSRVEGRKYAVYGNHDYGGGAKKVFRTTMEEAGFEILINRKVDLGGGVTLTGADDLFYGTPDVSGFETDGFDILAVHEPDFFREGHDFELQISGHTHGAQIRIPFFEKYILPKGGEDYISGCYEVGDQTVFVTRGLGTSILPVRFLAWPEIVLLEVGP